MCSSSAASGKKKKRVVLTIEERLKICDLVKNGRSLTRRNLTWEVNRSRHGDEQGEAPDFSYGFPRQRLH